MELKMSENEVSSEIRNTSEEEPEEGEIQDDGGWLEDVSSEDDLSATNKRTIDKFWYCDKYSKSPEKRTDYINSMLPQISRFSKVSEYETRRFPSTTERLPRLNSSTISKYREATGISNCESYTTRVRPDITDDLRREDNCEMLHNYKLVRSKSVKEEDIFQEKENRHESKKENKLKRKCKKKHQHSLKPESSRSLSSITRTSEHCGSKKLCARAMEKKRKDVPKLEAKYKNSHIKKKITSPKKEKHRNSRKRSKKIFVPNKLNIVEMSKNNNEEGNSLFKRLQTMMAVSVPAKSETLLNENDKSDGTKKNNESISIQNEKGDSIDVGTQEEILKKTEQNHENDEVSIIEMCKLKVPEPEIITLEDSDCDNIMTIEEIRIEEQNVTDVTKTTVGEENMNVVSEDEDLEKLRLDALQSNRRKEVSKPKIEDEEVMQLRLEALKSAIWKRYGDKKRNISRSKQIVSVAELDLDKIALPSNSTTLENSNKEICNVASIEPDETTTIVDMDLSHTDDEKDIESNSQHMLSDSHSNTIPLPDECTLLEMKKEYLKQNIHCKQEELQVASLESTCEKNANLTWNSSHMLYANLESNLPTENMEGVYDNNSFHYSNYSTSSYTQQAMYNEVYGNNISGLPSLDLDGVSLETIGSSYGSISPAISYTYGASDVIPPTVISDNCMSQEVEQEPPAPGTDTEIVESSSSILDTSLENSSSPLGNIPSKKKKKFERYSSNITIKLCNPTQLYIHSLMEKNSSKSDPIIIPRGNTHDSEDMNTFIENDSQNDTNELSVGKEKQITSELQETVIRPCTSLKASSENSKFKTGNIIASDTEEIGISHTPNSVIITVQPAKSDITESKNALGKENLSIDLDGAVISNSITKLSENYVNVHQVNDSENVDEDEETLRAKLLKSLAKKKLMSATNIITPNNIIPVSNQIVLKSSNSDSLNIKPCTKTQSFSTNQLKRYKLLDKKVDSIQKFNILRHNSAGKVWKKTFKKTPLGNNVKQALRKVNKNPQTLNKFSDMKTIIRHLKPGNSRVVMNTKNIKPTTLQVTVPFKADDIYCRRTVAENVTVNQDKRFVIQLGDDSDSGEEGKNVQVSKRRCVINKIATPLDSLTHDTNKVVSIQSSDKQNDTKIPINFEKSIDIFLKQARKSQEAKATSSKLSLITPKKIVEKKVIKEVSSVTPLAVRHLPTSQQEEYRRLKQQIAELELQNKLRNQKESSFPSSPSRSILMRNNKSAPIEIVANIRNPIEKDNVSVTLGQDRQIFKTAKVENNSVITLNKTVLVDNVKTTPSKVTRNTNTNINGIIVEPSDSRTQNKVTMVKQKEVKHPEVLSNKIEQAKIEKTVGNNPNVSEEKNISLSSIESVEKKQVKLSDAELQLLSKRDEVLDNLTNVGKLLQQVEMKQKEEGQCLAVVQRLQSELRLAEDHLIQQRKFLSSMHVDVAESYRKITKGRSECINLSKTCLELGKQVKGKLYKIPADGADLMKLKLKEVAAQTQQIAKRKYTKIDKSKFHLPRLLSGSPDSTISNSRSNSSFKDNINPCNKFGNVHGAVCNVSEIPKKFDTLLTCEPGSENKVDPAVEVDYVSVNVEDRTASESCDVDLKSCRDTILDIKQISCGKSEECPAICDPVMGMMSSEPRKAFILQSMVEYKSPLEHFQSIRNNSLSEWKGPLDPLAILCPYELMGSCQDEECFYQHYRPTT